MKSKILTISLLLILCSCNESNDEVENKLCDYPCHFIFDSRKVIDFELYTYTEGEIIKKPNFNSPFEFSMIKQFINEKWKTSSLPQKVVLESEYSILFKDKDQPDKQTNYSIKGNTIELESPPNNKLRLEDTGQVGSYDLKFYKTAIFINPDSNFKPRQGKTLTSIFSSDCNILDSSENHEALHELSDCDSLFTYQIIDTYKKND